MNYEQYLNLVKNATSYWDIKTVHDLMTWYILDGNAYISFQQGFTIRLKLVIDKPAKITVLTDVSITFKL